ncbi:hypothetical protein M2266_001722 [Streptomyces sp. SPB162]|nr:hypothetical protein [Streptomyces sp. SPB162]
MYSSNFSLPARRSAAAIGAAVALAAGALAVAPAAQAHPSGTSGGASGSGSERGRSTATVLRAGLDVSLLNKTVDVPLNVSLNDVKAPADADETALTAKLAGVDNGKPFTMLRADVATARATADAHKAEGYANLVRAEVHLPGLPLLSLIRIEAVTSKATCEAGRKPTASATLAGVRVLDKKISLTATGPATKVAVPGVGEVSLDLSKTWITTRTAAATGLELKVKVNPGHLNVADVSGTVTLVKAACEAPKVIDPTTGGTHGGATNGGATDGGAANGGATNGGATSGAANGGTGDGGSTGGASSGGSSTGGASGGSSGASGGSSGASGSGGTGGSGGSQPQSGPTTRKPRPDRQRFERPAARHGRRCARGGRRRSTVPGVPPPQGRAGAGGRRSGRVDGRLTTGWGPEGV